MTHDDLVRRAGKWLRRSLNCGVVMTELSTYAHSNETPDAIGWINQRSVLVECKTSRTDFKADMKKTSRSLGRAVGAWRFYLTPPGLISVDELPDGWGLYEVDGRKVKYVGGAEYKNAERPPFKSDKDSEVGMLLSAMRRIQARSAIFVVIDECKEEQDEDR